MAVAILVHREVDKFQLRSVTSKRGRCDNNQLNQSPKIKQELKNTYKDSNFSSKKVVRTRQKYRVLIILLVVLSVGGMAGTLKKQKFISKLDFFSHETVMYL